MGSITSRIYSPEAMLENFMVFYLSRKGPTAYNMDLIPGASPGWTRDRNDMRRKFGMARRQQEAIREALARKKSPVRCLSPCMITDFDLDGELEERQNQFSYTYNGDTSAPTNNNRSQSKSKVVGVKRSSLSRQGLGTLGKLVSFTEPSSIGQEQSEEVPTSSRRAEVSPSAELQTIREMVSDVVIEKVQLGGKKSKKVWPPRDSIRKVLKDAKNRPTTYFLGRFRPTPSSEYVEVDYRLNQQNGKENFNQKGASLDNLLTPEERLQYQADSLNNNLDDRHVFLQNLPHILNNHEGRIWWNGYLIFLDGPQSNRIPISSVRMSPPTLCLDMTGVEFVSASQEMGDLKVSIFGRNDKEGLPNKSFHISAKNKEDLQQITINHETNTFKVVVGLPLLSGVPGSVSKLMARRSRSRNLSRTKPEE